MPLSIFSGKTNRLPRQAIIILSLVGAAIMVYLTSVHYSLGQSSFCNFGAGLSCDLVNQSVYSKIFGIPVAVLGLAYFLAMLAPFLHPFFRNRPVFAYGLLLSVFGLAFSLTLTAVEIFEIGSICLYCELSKAVMAALIVVSAYAAHAAKEKTRAACLAAAVAVGLAMGLFVIVVSRS